MIRPKGYKKVRKDMISDVRYFFLNNPVKKVRETLWDLYREWVHASGDTGSGQHSAMLLFYEYLAELIQELNVANEILKDNSGK